MQEEIARLELELTTIELQHGVLLLSQPALAEELTISIGRLGDKLAYARETKRFEDILETYRAGLSVSGVMSGDTIQLDTNLRGKMLEIEGTDPGETMTRDEMKRVLRRHWEGLSIARSNYSSA